ncbi:hypothetical protein DEH69_01380 [Streptomyces sp. PT12]|nr:hypothetical protein DEH69_01380 [Streptomyces sp. PT12]
MALSRQGVRDHGRAGAHAGAHTWRGRGFRDGRCRSGAPGAGGQGRGRGRVSGAGCQGPSAVAHATTTTSAGHRGCLGQPETAARRGHTHQ